VPSFQVVAERGVVGALAALEVIRSVPCSFVMVREDRDRRPLQIEHLHVRVGERMSKPLSDRSLVLVGIRTAERTQVDHLL
jgi:hypothetical protein